MTQIAHIEKLLSELTYAVNELKLKEVKKVKVNNRYRVRESLKKSSIYNHKK